MENAKFRVVEFEESDVLTASTIPGTTSGHGAEKLGLKITGYNDWGYVEGDAYTYQNGTYVFAGRYSYEGSHLGNPSVGSWYAADGMYDNNGGSAVLCYEWVKAEYKDGTFFNGDFYNGHICNFN